MSNKLSPRNNTEPHQPIKSENSDKKTCENCYAEVTGAYCAQCGQEVESTLKYFWTVVLHLLDDIFSFDSRASRTLVPLLSKPGFLTQQYFLGHRVQYVPPLRLYLFVSIIFFLSLKLFTNVGSQNLVNAKVHHQTQQALENKIKALSTDPAAVTKNQLVIEKLETLLADLTVSNKYMVRDLTNQLAELTLKELEQNATLNDVDYQKVEALKAQLEKAKSGVNIDAELTDFSISNSIEGKMSLPFLSPEANKKFDQYAKTFESKVRNQLVEDPKKLLTLALDKAPQLMFVLLPVFALLLKILYLFSNRLYLEHLTVALHSHSFIFLSILIIELLSVLSEKVNFYALEYINVGLMIWLPAYLYLMQKRIYQQSHLVTVVKYLITSSLYLLLIVFTGLIAFVWGAMTL
ncbi:hypothetical protein tinsulaeT_29420 [Thalassotalea insulae]|uniref:DUF3667 domain-containing protein n=1 Tax=Thalassotalea insulae TaxID=2056778 RepID=A0ABQ6GUN4_9GAMM|nr:DUF3667 domain-containing protein [Thalassotalea insulae]GLX79602.1 hypothetical protein tinsulaeT_29420 [Thalassotalea insulae]